jgi:hypothetical protein
VSIGVLFPLQPDRLVPESLPDPYHIGKIRDHYHLRALDSRRSSGPPRLAAVSFRWAILRKTWSLGLVKLTCSQAFFTIMSISTPD